MIHLPPQSDFHHLPLQEGRFFEIVKNFSEDRQKALLKTYRHAKKAHEGQMRDDGTPYILHPLRATICLMSEAGVTDHNILSAMLLHDTIEDTPLTYDHIARDFGQEVARLVKNVTRPKQTQCDEETIQRDKEKKFMAVMNMDEKTRLIKCADVLDNVRSWPNIPCGSMAQKKLPRWHQEVEQYALPMAKKTHPVLFRELTSAFSFAQSHKDLCAPVHS